ncbi:MAG TPA: hypothetical protein VIR16_07655 [Candidatus Limnocylindrales bacterium]
MKKVAGILVALAFAACGGGGGGGGSSITFNPASQNCSSPAPWTETDQLPASLKAGDTVTSTLDGIKESSGTWPPAGATKNGDGSWTDVTTFTVAQIQQSCEMASALLPLMYPGTHTIAWLDSSGKVLAQGTYSVTK